MTTTTNHDNRSTKCSEGKKHPYLEICGEKTLEMARIV